MPSRESNLAVCGPVAGPVVAGLGRIAEPNREMPITSPSPKQHSPNSFMHMRTPPGRRARAEQIRKVATQVFVAMHVATIIGFVHLRGKKCAR